MDANSPQVRPDDPDRQPSTKLLLEAPVLPYAASAFGGTCLGYYAAAGPPGTPGSPGPAGPAGLWVAGLAILGLLALLRPRIRRLGALCVLVAVGTGVGTDGRPPDLSWIDPDVPVLVEGRVASHPRGVPGEEWLWLRLDRVTQRQRSVAGGIDVLVGLPDADRPAGRERPAWGQAVELKGYLRTSPRLDNGVATRQGPWRLHLSSWRFWQVTSPPAGWKRLATGLRQALDARLSAEGGASVGGRLRRALLLGSPDDLPERLQRRLRATGLSHLLAVSGLHVGLVAGWLWLAAMPFGRRMRLLLALVGVGAYLLLVGPKASALRAAGMAAVIGLSLSLRRPPQALNAAALWATVLVLWDPQTLDDLGYRLSVAATLGILAFGPGAARSLTDAARACGLRGRGVELLCRAVAVGLAAQLTTLPLLTPWTALVHPASPWLNLLAIPWLSVFLALSFSSASCLGVLDWVFVPLLDFLALPLEALVDSPPALWTTLPASLSPVQCLVVSTLLLALLLRPSASLRCAFWIAVLGLRAGSPDLADPPAHLEFLRLDVGQGDALLLRDGRRAMLVDGGGWRRGDIATRVLVPALARHGVQRLDAVVLSHPDTDHCRGLVDLASYVAVDEIWTAPGWSDGCALELLAVSAAPWRSLWRGDRAEVGRWRVEVLWPPPGLRRAEANDRSLVLRATAGRQRILLAADVTASVERRLLRLEGEELRSTILGVGHHGSKTSTSPAFLARVSPRLATVGVGARNAYGHPHPSVVERLERAGVRIHRTDRTGVLRLRLEP